jgi:hypothetical protein
VRIELQGAALIITLRTQPARQVVLRAAAEREIDDIECALNGSDAQADSVFAGRRLHGLHDLQCFVA